MYLTKGGITIEVIHPSDIKRYKSAGYVDAEVGYPNPEAVIDGEKVESKPAPEKDAGEDAPADQKRQGKSKKAGDKPAKGS